MKPFFKITILCFSVIFFFRCSSSNNNDEDTVNCDQQIIIIEREVISPITGTSYFQNFTYNSVQANSSKITVNALAYVNQTPILIEVKNFILTEGTQQLNSNPYGKIIHNGFTYTTYYSPNGQSSYPVNPEGELVITNYSQECNTISGTVSIQAWGNHNDFGEVRSSAKFDFENIPLDNQIHQL